MTEFLWPIRVYYEDTDSGGVVYYANYLKFMERARTEMLRASGFEQDQLREDRDLLFVVRSVELELKQPARFNDELIVQTRITSMSGTSLNFKQAILRKDEQDNIMAAGNTKVVCISASSWRPVRIPDDIQMEIKRVD